MEVPNCGPSNLDEFGRPWFPTKIGGVGATIQRPTEPSEELCRAESDHVLVPATSEVFRQAGRASKPVFSCRESTSLFSARMALVSPDLIGNRCLRCPRLNHSTAGIALRILLASVNSDGTSRTFKSFLGAIEGPGLGVPGPGSVRDLNHGATSTDALNQVCHAPENGDGHPPFLRGERLGPRPLDVLMNGQSPHRAAATTRSPEKPGSWGSGVISPGTGPRCPLRSR